MKISSKAKHAILIGSLCSVSYFAVYTFDDEGNVVGEYMDVDGVNVGLTGETGTDKGIGARRYSENLLKNHDFQENAVSIDGGWSVQDTGSLTCLTNYGNAKHGNYCLYLQREQAGSSVLSQNVGELQPGDYTFSAYVRTLDEGIDGGIVLGVQSGTATLGQSDGIMKTPAGEYERLTASFHLTVEADVTVKIAFGGIGKVLVDSAQLEKNGYAGAYNLLHNGSFERVSWEWTIPTTHESITQADHFNGSRSLDVIGALDEAHGASQTVDVIATSSTRETFTLSGWAKAEGALPNAAEKGDHAPTFRLRAEIKLCNVEEPEVYTADFAPCTTGWQYAEVQFAKAQFATVESLKVYCDYDYNNGVAYSTISSLCGIPSKPT